MEKIVMSGFSFPLTADQKPLYELTKFLPINTLNLTTRIDLESEIDEYTVLEAMRLTVKRIDYLNIRLRKDASGNVEQYFSNLEPEGIELLDFTNSSSKKIDEYCNKLGADAFDNNALDVPLYRFKLLRCPNNKHTMVIGGFHITMDAHALMVVISYFDKVYSALISKTELPEKLSDCDKLIKWSFDYTVAGKPVRDNEKMLDRLTPEPVFTSINGIGSPEFVKGKKYGKGQNIRQYKVGNIVKPFPMVLLDKINDASKSSGLSSQLYIMLALRTFLGEVSKTDDVTFVSTAARRATLIQKKGGLTIAHFVYIRSVIDNQSTASEALAKLNIIRNDAYKYAGQTTDVIDQELFNRYSVPENHRYWSVNLTYQPYFDLKSTGLKFSVQYLHSDFTPYPLYINIMPQNSTGEMWIDYLYAKNYIKPKSCEKLHDFMLKFIEAVIASPEKTIAQLTEECM